MKALGMRSYVKHLRFSGIEIIHDLLPHGSVVIMAVVTRLGDFGLAYRLLEVFEDWYIRF